MSQLHPRVLLVEGQDELRVIPFLIEANGINWGTEKNPCVQIQEFGGYENLSKPKVISAQLKASGLRFLGIMIDADYDPVNRWKSIRNAAIKSIPTLPQNLPEEGLIHSTPQGIKFGIWMMPDNKVRGMLETFLTTMIPVGKEELWQFTQTVTQEAKRKGADFKDSHLDKANIYTWLAWQDPPGLQLNTAVKKAVEKERILNLRHPNAECFVTWFRNLYDL